MFADLTRFFNLKNSLTRTFLFLSFFGFVALADLLIPTTNPTQKTNFIAAFVFTFITAGTVFYIVHYGFNFVSSNPINFLISTWIVFLLMHPSNSLWMFPVAIVCIAIGKFLFKKNSMPIFNPAAMGVALTFIIAKIINLVNPNSDTLLISWWGADLFQNITRDIPFVSIIIPLVFFLGFLYFANSFKKIPYVLAYLLSFLVLSFVYITMTDSMDRAVSFVSLAFFNATAFCALVMIPEPKTSPNFLNQQIIVGIIAGLALFIFNWFFGTLPIDALINSILVANIATLLFKVMKQRPKPVAQSAQTASTNTNTTVTSTSTAQPQQE